MTSLGEEMEETGRGTIRPLTDDSNVLMSPVKSEFDGDYDIDRDINVENVEHGISKNTNKKRVITKSDVQNNEEQLVLNQFRQKRKGGVQSGEIRSSLENQESDVFVDESEYSGSEYEPSITSGGSNSSYSLINKGEKDKYENSQRNDEISSKVVSPVKKAKPRRHKDEAVKSNDDKNCSKEDHLIEVTSENDDRVPFPSYKDRITKAENGLFLFNGQSLFRCNSTSMECVTCDLTYQSISSIKEHLRDICPGGPPTDVVKSVQSNAFFYDQLKSGDFQCRHCKHSCSHNAEMVLHVKKCHQGRSFSQVKPYYAEVGPNKYVCNHKYLFEFVNDQYKCGTCCEDFLTLDETVSHIHKGHTLPLYADENRFSCPECRKVFSQKWKLNRHKEIHHNSGSFVCEICRKSFKLLHYLYKHKRLLHPETASKQYSCNVCNRTFGLPGLLKAHHVQKHERLACNICGKTLGRYDIKDHMLTHSTENTLKCQKCNKTFQHQCSLSRHLQTHHEPKHFSCDVCGMKFTRTDSVRRHKNVVHNTNKPTKTSSKTKKKKQPVTSNDEETLLSEDGDFGSEDDGNR